MGQPVALTFANCARCASNDPAYCERSTDLNMRGDGGDEASAFSRDGSPIAGGFLGQSSSATYAIARQGNTVAGAETRRRRGDLRVGRGGVFCRDGRATGGLPDRRRGRPASTPSSAAIGRRCRLPSRLVSGQGSASRETGTGYRTVSSCLRQRCRTRWEHAWDVARRPDRDRKSVV